MKLRSVTCLLLTTLAGCSSPRPMLRSSDESLGDARRPTLPLTRPVLPPLVIPPHHTSDVSRQTLPAQPAFLFVSDTVTVGSLGSTIERSIRNLEANAAVQKAKAGPMIVIYHNWATDLATPVSVEVGVVVRPDTSAIKGLRIKRLAPLETLCVTYTGPISTIDRAYDILRQEIPGGSGKPAGEIREVYEKWDGPAASSNVIVIGVEQH